jgi:PAS domain S-box-containing protein
MCPIADRDGAVVGMTPVATDATERLRADARFLGLLEAVPDAMMCVRADGRIALVNAETERLFGYRRDDLIGQSVEMLLPEAMRDAHLGRRAGYEADPQPRPMGAGSQLAGRRRDASTFPADISLSTIDTDEGPLITAAVRDMTEHQQVKDLERANRNMETFAYSVAHDLRAPLRALSGFSEALLEDYGDILDDEGRDYAGRIVEASEQMATLIDDLLRLSRISRAEAHLHAVDLGAEAVRIAGELQRGDPGRRVSFAIQQPVRVQADPGLIRTVLQNLLENAWKFTSGQDDASIEFGANPAEDGHLYCYVRDNGAGFDPAYSDQLFQPFQRLHKTREFPGTGVGLASVRQIVERHGGRVGAEGAIGKGAAFHFTIKAEEIT